MEYILSYNLGILHITDGIVDSAISTEYGDVANYFLGFTLEEALDDIEGDYYLMEVV